MSSYIFGTNVSEAQSATENIQKYRQDRRNVLENYINAIITEIKKKIEYSSRRLGNNCLELNLSQIKYENTNSPIDFGNPSEVEIDTILDRISDYLTAEGFSYEMHNKIYKTYNYRSIIKISWPRPSPEKDHEST